MDVVRQPSCLRSARTHDSRNALANTLQRHVHSVVLGTALVVDSGRVNSELGIFVRCLGHVATAFNLPA